MFTEVKNTQRKRNEPKKRWFSSQSMDIFVWLDDEDEIVGYHLTYNKPHDEKALIWSREDGFDHLGVDDGSRPGKYPASPLLIKDGAFQPAKIVSLLKQDTGDLKGWIKDFIVGGIEKEFDPGESEQSS